MVIMSTRSTLYNIVTGAQMAGFVGKNVSVYGFVSGSRVGDRTFTLRSSDDLMVSVELDKPLTEDIDGYVEVKGVCQHGKKIKANEFFTFNNDKFNSNHHVELCKILNSLPNIYRSQKP
ncbi:uncharacterized protein LOC123015778 [Tribolium madens]|uniref:uncharacterized protein LOC123015778 n=1 Tax=Tribolium madens TaxID=41895 RepID=UPI001CF729FA|nr:uncharacterized protein LOC123015778 [Tribolium madens]